MSMSKKKSKVHVKTGDEVMIISGKDAKKVGKVVAVSPEEGKVIVEKLNMVTKHVKPKKAGDPSGIIKAEGALHACKVQLYCGKCKARTRAGHSFDKEGNKQRICVKCKAELK